MTKPQNVKWKTGSIRPVEKRLSECAWKMRWQLNIYRKWQHQTVKNIDGIEKKRRTSAIQGKNRVNIFCALFFFHCLTLASLTFGIHFFIVRNFYLEPNDRNAIITVIISQWMLHSVFALLILPLLLLLSADVMMSKILKHNSCFTHVTDQRYSCVVSGWQKPINKKNVGKNSDKFLLLQLLFIVSSNHGAFFNRSLSLSLFLVVVVCIAVVSEPRHKHTKIENAFFRYWIRQKWSVTKQWITPKKPHTRSQKLTRKLEANVLISLRSFTIARVKSVSLSL